MRGSPGGSSTRLAFLEHDREPIAGEQLFTGLQGLGLISSKHRHYRDALGQVSYYLKKWRHRGSEEQLAEGSITQSMGVGDTA